MRICARGTKHAIVRKTRGLFAVSVLPCNPAAPSSDPHAVFDALMKSVPLYRLVQKPKSTTSTCSGFVWQLSRSLKEAVQHLDTSRFAAYAFYFFLRTCCTAFDFSDFSVLQHVVQQIHNKSQKVEFVFSFSHSACLWRSLNCCWVFKLFCMLSVLIHLLVNFRFGFVAHT